MTDTPVSHPLAQRIASLRLPGMLAAFLEQMARHDLGDMPFEDRLALLIDREISERQSKALQRRLKKAQLRQQDACFEDINLSRPRGLDRSVVLGLGDCAWIRNGANILITGPCGTGKSWIACALAHKACLEGHQAQYLRVPRLLTDLRTPMERAPSRSSTATSPASSCSSSTTGVWRRSTLRGHVTSSKSSTTASAAARRSSPVSCRSPTGTASSTIHRGRRHPRPSRSWRHPARASRHVHAHRGRRRWSQTMKAAGSRASRGRTVAPLRLVKGHASRAPHAPPACCRAFGRDIVEEEIAKGKLPTTT